MSDAGSFREEGSDYSFESMGFDFRVGEEGSDFASDGSFGSPEPPPDARPQVERRMELLGDCGEADCAVRRCWALRFADLADEAWLLRVTQVKTLKQRREDQCRVLARCGAFLGARFCRLRQVCRDFRQLEPFELGDLELQGGVFRASVGGVQDAFVTVDWDKEARERQISGELAWLCAVATRLGLGLKTLCSPDSHVAVVTHAPVLMDPAARAGDWEQLVRSVWTRVEVEGGAGLALHCGDSLRCEIDGNDQAPPFDPTACTFLLEIDTRHFDAQDPLLAFKLRAAPVAALEAGPLARTLLRAALRAGSSTCRILDLVAQRRGVPVASLVEECRAHCDPRRTTIARSSDLFPISLADLYQSSK